MNGEPDFLKSSNEVDLSRNPRVPHLIEMMRSVSKATDPDEAYEIFASTMRKVFPSIALITLSTSGLEPGQFRLLQQVDHLGEIQVHRPVLGDSVLQEPVRSGGFLGQMIARQRPQLFHGVDVPQDPAMGEFLAPYHSVMAAPIYLEGDVTHWGVLLDRRKESFSEEQLEHFVLRVNLMGSTLQTIMTAQDLRHAVDLNKTEIERIASIQRALLPSSPPEIPGVEIDISYETFDQAGGDIYVVREICSEEEGPAPVGCWSVVVGDVSGHGPAATVIMGIVDALLISYPHADWSPSPVLEYLNERLCEKRIEGSFVTAIVGVYDAIKHQFTYGLAGHPPLLRQRQGGNGTVSVDRYDVGGIPLGVMPGVKYPQETIDLSPGDTLALYTDGITESRAPDGKFFGVEGLQKAMEECQGDVYCVVESVMEILKKHERGGRPQDDQTLLAMQLVDNATG
ncbi:MAG: PP2C family protein-serine/threonine phosphatase [Planctomycetota bacterium]|nr:PP2C family protein-serine/threonine phosphatase [Planctomycetota bacterium]